ncbi:MAG: hypothetical protein JRF41_08280 [Deltaproteobacteria bacterium]|nr:hypothetical protein [Deltaproteobacteria bacterium]
MYSLTHPFYAASGGEYNPKRYIKEQIKALQEEKARLLESEITKEEFLEHVKSKFKAERQSSRIHWPSPCYGKVGMAGFYQNQFKSTSSQSGINFLLLLVNYRL